MPRKKSRRKKKKTTWVKLESEVASSVVGVIMLAIAIVAALAHFGIASGWFASLISSTSILLFGKGAFLFPLILLIAALYILFSHKPQVIGSAILGGILLLLSLLGLIEIFGKNGGHIGGWVGFIFSWPLYRSLGFWGAFVFMLAFFVSGLLITFRIPLGSHAREVFLPGDEDEEKAGVVVEKGLIGTIAGVFKQVTPRKKSAAPPPADKTMTVNLPAGLPASQAGQAGAPAQTQKPASAIADPKGFSIIPAPKGYKFPPLDLLEEPSGSPVSGDIKANALIIQKTLEHFGIPVEMAEVNVGPSITQFTLKPATGIKLSKLVVLQNDLALALAAHPLRIEAPIPGKSLVGIEIPNRRSTFVRLREMLELFNPDEYPGALNFAVGRDVSGVPYWTTLTRMPHLLIAGATGTGKTIAINSMLLSFLFRHSPEMLRLILIDPKRVELTSYNGIPHLLTPVITEPKKAIAALKWAVTEMERRFDMLSEDRVRDIAGYNAKQKSKRDAEFMPYLVIVIDELADLMASYGREVEGTIVRLAQMARAVGIHLVVATQRPSVEVITGLIKANITTRMAFQVASQVDSRTILDSAGAEKLLGSGDMLYMGAEFTKPKRIQGTFIAEEEIKKVVKFLRQAAESAKVSEEEKAQPVPAVPSGLTDAITESRPAIDFDKIDDVSDYEDELYSKAEEVVIQAGKASASLLQRRLRVGYARAARLLDILEDRGVVGPGEGAKPREVYGETAREEEHGDGHQENYGKE